MNASGASQTAMAMYRSLVGIGCICALLIVGVYLLTAPVIAHNRAVALQQAIFGVLPGTTRTVALRQGTDARFQLAGEGESADLYLGLNADGAMTGVAIEASGMGYQDLIRLIYGYSPTSGRIVGMQVLESRETPGLGDKIVHDADFLSVFTSLEVPLSVDGNAVREPVRAVKAGESREPWEFDAITGATISSRAVASILTGSTARWVPAVHAQRSQLDRIGSDDR